MSQLNGAAATFSIIDVLRGMVRRKLLVLGCLTTGLLLGVGLVSVTKPKFQAEARILIENLSTPYDSPNVSQLDRREGVIDERAISTQVAIMQSEDMGSRVIKQLALSDNDEFDPVRRGIGTLKQVLIKTGFRDDPRLMTPEQRSYDQLSGSLTVYPLPMSNVIGVKYTSGHAEIAAAVANAIAETYVISTRETRSGDTDRARLWLSTQVDALRKKVAESDAAVEKYRAEAGLLKGQNATLGTQEISELNSQITLAEAAKTEAQAKADEIRELLESQGSVEASSEVLASPIIQRLREQQVAAERRVTDLSVTYLANHPKMIAAQKEVRSLDRRVRDEAMKIVDGLQGQAKIAATRAASLRRSLEDLKNREGGALQDEVKLKELEREAKANRDQLEVMLSRFADSNTRQNLEQQPGFARVIQVATIPAAPYFPRVGPIILLATLAGLGLGLGLAFLLEIMALAARMNNAALTSRDHERRLQHPAHSANVPDISIQHVQAQQSVVRPAVQTSSNVVHVVPSLPVLATIPPARNYIQARNLVSILDNDDRSSGALARLLTEIKAFSQSGSLGACAITGIGCGVEVSSIALSLARQLANAGSKTVLVELVAQNAVLADLLDFPPAPGLTDLLAGGTDFKGSIQSDQHSKLQFIRHGAVEKLNAAQLHDRMHAITQTLLGIYDVVLLHVGEASPAMLDLIKGCGSVIVHTTAMRKKDAVAAANTLRSRGHQNIMMVQVRESQQAVA